MATQAERRLKAVEEELGRHASEIEGIWSKARKEDRETSKEERETVAEHLKAVDSLKAQKADAEHEVGVEKDVREVSRKFGKMDEEQHSAPRVKSGGEPMDRIGAYAQKTLGQMFVESEQFKSTSFQGQFSTGMVELGTKGTLTESGGGGAALAAPVPQVIPGVVDKLFHPLSISDLLLSGQATTNSLRYVVEGTATSGAAGVAEGGAKPESTLGLTTTDEPVKKIATTLVVSDEMLEDAAQVESYINGRLSLFVRIEEERQLARGSGTNEIIGIMPTGNTRGINIYAGGTAAGTKAEQLFKALNGQRGSALIEPDFIVLHPSDWQDLRLAKDTANQYYGGGPFQGPYGSGSNLSASGQVTGAADSIWNKPVVVTTALGNAGTALIGTTSAGQIWRRSGISVEATNSHSDYFTKNLVAIRAEQRFALAVYRPSAFTEVRLA